MKKVAAVLLFVITMCATPAMADNPPESIAGITLGKNYDSIRSMLEMDSMDSRWNEDYLKRIEIEPMEGYRSGYIVVGNCKRKNEILKMKLNYEDDSVKFFEKIYDKLNKRYGNPSDWRGNPFGTLKVWKWSLHDEKGNISLILHHFSGDDDSITQGNSIKLSRPGFLTEERSCWKKKHPQPDEPSIPAKRKGLNWYLPY